MKTIPSDLNELKVLNTYPPEWAEIIKAFPDAAKAPNIFTVKCVIYNPQKLRLTDDMLFHERVHMVQQEAVGWDEYWPKYRDDPQFRLDVELAAYKAQLSYIKERANGDQYARSLGRFADALSHPLYGNLVSRKQAFNLLQLP